MGAQASRHHSQLRSLPASQCRARPRFDSRRARVPRAARLPVLIPLAILGGTFDPVHYGHLGLAADVAAALATIDVRLFPGGDPPHRGRPHASAADRVSMLEIALREFPQLSLDTREVERGGKSYTIDTLADLRAEVPARPLALLVGADAFLGLPTWHRWEGLFDLAHVVVIPRPGIQLESRLTGPLASQWQTRLATDPEVLRTTTAGSIYVQPVTAQPISSTAIRAALAAGHARSVEFAGLLPAAVMAYIESHHLYVSTR